MKKNKGQTAHRPRYGLLSCVAYIYRYLWRHDRRLALHGVLTVPVTLIAAALSLYVPSLILNVLEQGETFHYIALVIVGLLLATFLAELGGELLKARNATAELYMTNYLLYEQLSRQKTRDWHLQYEREVQELDQRAGKAVASNHTAGVHLPMNFAAIVATVLNLLLFGGVVSLLNPVIVLLLAVGCAITYAMAAWERRVRYQQQDEENLLDKKTKYFLSLSGNFKVGKDIRLYRMQGYLHGLGQKLIGQTQAFIARLERRSFLTAAVGLLVVLLRDGLAYGFLIYKAVAGELRAAEFVLYFNAITALSGYMSEVLSSWGQVAEGALQISDYREDMEIPDAMPEAGIPAPQSPFSIEFRDVCYQYPMGEKPILEHVSFKIEAGEKIALVGMNGAGKSTMTLLMCGLLLPDSGDVLIDGHPILSYGRDALYGLFGLVPQNYNLLPMSIGRNIACAMTEEQIDRGRLWRCLDTVGLAEKIRALPAGEHTPLNRSVFSDAVELSGGEKQKLLMARLLYKAPPCMILDEPTAALDPIAESRMYEKYNEITRHATSVFISHRLASTRFCDRIFLLDGARLAEIGTHDELMAAGGRYRELFDVQSRYYKEGGAESEDTEIAG